jgi:inner membrane protein
VEYSASAWLDAETTVPTVLTHPAVPLAVRAWTGGRRTSPRLLLVAALGSVAPDVDALGFFAGVPYGSLFGHRGFTHSLPFALLLAGCALPFAKWLQAGRGWVFALVFLATASHGVLDALTDGGLGVAFLSPFSNERYFLPWRPIHVSPLGVAELFSKYGLRVLASEVVLVWLPCLVVALAARAAQVRDRRKGAG